MNTGNKRGSKKKMKLEFIILRGPHPSSNGHPVEDIPQQHPHHNIVSEVENNPLAILFPLRGGVGGARIGGGGGGWGSGLRHGTNSFPSRLNHSLEEKVIRA